MYAWDTGLISGVKYPLVLAQARITRLLLGICHNPMGLLLLYFKEKHMASSTKDRSPFPRTRERLVAVRDRPAGYITNRVNGVITAGPNFFPASHELYKQVTFDWVTPGYQQLIAKGVIVNAPFSSVKSLKSGGTYGPVQGTVSKDGNTFVYDCDDGWRMYLSGTASTSGVDKINTNNLIRRVQTKALAGVEKPELQAMVSLAEFKQTVSLLSGPLGRLNAAFRKLGKQYENDLRRGALQQTWASAGRTVRSRRRRRASIAAREKDRRKKSASQRIDAFADTLTSAVLGYNLGWKPAMMEIDALLNKIPSLSFEARTWSRASDTETYDGSYTTTHSTPWSTVTILHTLKQSATVRAGVLYNSELQTPQQHFGIRLADIPEAMWELIPFSFVLDYVVNVEQYIAACRAALTARIITQYTSVHLESEHTATVQSETPTVCQTPGFTGVTWTVSMGITGGSEFASYEARMRWPDSFGPNLAYNLKGYGDNRPPAHVQNALALLTNGLRDLARLR